MHFLPKIPRFFARSSKRHVLWQIEQIDCTLRVAGKLLEEAATPAAKATARERVNSLLGHRIELMAMRDGRAPMPTEAQA